MRGEASYVAVGSGTPASCSGPMAPLLQPGARHGRDRLHLLAADFLPATVSGRLARAGRPFPQWKRLPRPPHKPSGTGAAAMDASRTGDPSQASELEAAAWFFENSLDVFLVIRDGVICRVNPAWTALTGWTAGRLAASRPTEFVHPDDWAAVRDAVGALRPAANTATQTACSPNPATGCGSRARTRRAADGSALVALKDVTEERTRQAEAAGVARSGELLRDEAGLILWRFDPEHRIYDTGADLSRPIGAKGAISTQPADAVAAIVHPDDAAAMGRAFVRTSRTGEPGADIATSAADGWARCRVAWRGIRRRMNGWQMIGVTPGRHRTRRRARRGAGRPTGGAGGERSRTPQFLANMSHEIRTPDERRAGRAAPPEDRAAVRRRPRPARRGAGLRRHAGPLSTT